MHKTSTINLSGQLFNIDEDAYRLLKTYLDRLREQLKNDDDRDEIMQDFEQAIAEHFMDALPSKDKAVTVALVNRVTKTIGDYEPTEAAESEEKADDDGWRKHFRRTLYLNKDDAIIAGVCGGIARALDVDSFWIRVLFVILVFATSGFMIVIYIILSFIMLDPAETTPLFKRNGKPLTASALVANSKQRFHETRETLTSEATQRRFSPLARAFKRLIRIAAVAVSSVLIVLVTVGYTALMVTWLAHRNSTGQPFSASPGGVNYGLIFGSYLVIVLPLLVVLLVAASRRIAHMAMDMRVALLLFGTWLIALAMFVGAAALAIPDWAQWSRQHPHNPYFQLEVNKGHLDNLCVDAAGDCNDHPSYQAKPHSPQQPNDIPAQPAPPKPVMLKR